MADFTSREKDMEDYRKEDLERYKPKPCAHGYTPTIRTRSGKYFDFVNPHPDQITIEDIAGALSKICRFGSHIERFYSVAEHSVLCAQVASMDGASTEAIKAVLLHDAAEAYCGDMVKPLKVLLPEYSVIEKRVEDYIELKFGIRFSHYSSYIREIDLGLLMAERRALFSPDKVEWTSEKEARKLDIVPEGLNPYAAETQFIQVFMRLWPWPDYAARH